MNLISKVISFFNKKNITEDNVEYVKPKAIRHYDELTYKYHCVIGSNLSEEGLIEEVELFRTGVFRHLGLTLEKTIFFKGHEMVDAFKLGTYENTTKTMFVINASNITHDNWNDFRRYLQLLVQDAATKYNYYYLIVPEFEKTVDIELIEENYPNFKSILVKNGQISV